MDFEIKEKTNDVLYDIPKVQFPSFDSYKEQALEIADYIRSFNVSPDNVKDVKATLAKARKLTDRLNRERIDIKKEILSNYNLFELQVKELSSIIDDADSELRAKVKALEEEERRQKRSLLYDIWEKRVSGYPDIKNLIPDSFERWLKPSYLNKTASVNVTEGDMTAWLEETQRGIDAARAMGEEYLTEYVINGSLTGAVEAVLARKAVQDLIIPEDPEEDIAVFEVVGTKDIKLAEMLLTESNINYRRR